MTNHDRDAVAILIPAYNPDRKLLALLDALKGRFSHIVAVNDGSTVGRDVFDGVRAQGVPVVVHETNRGKGAALKTGFAWIAEHLPGCKTVVTADADGQHTPDDIESVAEASLAHPQALTLGVRAFSGKVPFRSRFGNWWTRQFFFLMTGLRIRDTQTGLRGIPSALLPRMLALEGERYEYEMRMLADAKRHAEPPVQVPIATVYIEENASSHFNPLRDSIRIYGALLRFCISSVAGFLIDNAVFTAVLYAMVRFVGWQRSACVFVALVAARTVSSTSNYAFNRKLVFRSRSPNGRAFARYLALVVAIMTADYLFTTAMSWIFDARGFEITLVKIASETLLFFASYNIQRRWVFK